MKFPQIKNPVNLPINTKGLDEFSADRLRAIVKGLRGWIVHYLLDGQDLTEFILAPNRYSAVEESRKRHPTAYVYHAREEGTK